MQTEPRPFYEIVQSRLAELGENAFSMASKSGVAYDKFRNILRNDDRRADPKVETAREVCEALGLELYIGPPRDHAPIRQISVGGDDFAQIPLHEAVLSAGLGIENSTEHVSDYLAFRKDWLRRIGVLPSNAVLARAKGDSMQPCIWDGDILLIDSKKIEPPQILKTEKPRTKTPIYALLHDGEAKVKRVMGIEPGVFTLLSDNPDYPPQLATADRLNIIGKVLWWGHTNRDGS